MTFTHGSISAGDFAGATPEALEAALDNAWSTRSAATDQACQILAARILAAVMDHVPAARTVILREDTSHLPAHGHVDGVLDADGVDVLPRLSAVWHDLPWTSAVDEDVWDMYHLAPHLFAPMEDGKRRLRLVAATPTN